MPKCKNDQIARKPDKRVSQITRLSKGRNSAKTKETKIDAIIALSMIAKSFCFNNTSSKLSSPKTNLHL